jgi:hypothetical protein
MRADAAIAFVRGSIFVSLPNSLLATHSAPPPKASTLASGTSKTRWMRSSEGSILSTRECPWEAQTELAPNATPPPLRGWSNPLRGRRMRCAIVP